MKNVPNQYARRFFDHPKCMISNCGPFGNMEGHSHVNGHIAHVCSCHRIAKSSGRFCNQVPRSQFLNFLHVVHLQNLT